MGLKDSKIVLPLQARLLLVLLALLVLNGLLFWYGIAPRRSQLARLTDRITALRAEVQKGRIVEVRLPQFRQEISKQREHLRHLREILPEEKETADIVRKIEQLAAGSSLKIRSFTPQPSVRRDFYEDWPILIAVEGDYSSLALFLEKVSRFNRIINVENIAIRGLDGPNSRRTLSATCTATTFVFLPGKGPA